MREEIEEEERKHVKTMKERNNLNGSEERNMKQQHGYNRKKKAAKSMSINSISETENCRRRIEQQTYNNLRRKAEKCEEIIIWKNSERAGG